MTSPGCRRTKRVSRHVNDPLLGDDPAVRVSVHTAAMATAGIGSAVGRGRHLMRGTPRRVPAEDHAAGNSSWCVMPGRDAHLPAKRRSARRPGDRSNHVERVIDVVVAPRTPGIRFAAAGTRLGGCSASADRRPRCAYSSARGSERRYADDRCSRRRLPGTSGSGVYQQLYLQRRPARCLKPPG
jgi:hypothetical protein